MEQAATLKQVFKDSINFEQEPKSLLRRKAEIICKLHKRDESYGELVQYVMVLAQ